MLNFVRSRGNIAIIDPFWRASEKNTGSNCCEQGHYNLSKYPYLSQDSGMKPHHYAQQQHWGYQQGGAPLGYHGAVTQPDSGYSTSVENLSIEDKRTLQEQRRQEPQGEEQRLDVATESRSKERLPTYEEAKKQLEAQKQPSPVIPESSCISSRQVTQQTSAFYVTGSTNVSRPEKQQTSGSSSWPSGACAKPSLSERIRDLTTEEESGEFGRMLRQKLADRPPRRKDKDGWQVTDLDSTDIPDKRRSKEICPQRPPPPRSYSPPPYNPGLDYVQQQQQQQQATMLQQQTTMLQQQTTMSQQQQTTRPTPSPQQQQSNHHHLGNPKKSGRSKEEDVDYKVVAYKMQQMVQVLSDENKALREELEVYYKRVEKLQKFEMEIKRITDAHDRLVQSTSKREELEGQMRTKLNTEIKRLQDTNRSLREQLEESCHQLAQRQATAEEDANLRKELSRKETLVQQLIAQNKDQMGMKARLEMELAATNATLNDQRSHIEILDKALSNAQANVLRLDEECRKKQIYADRVDKLQRALTALQAACEKREVLEKRLRARYEQELETLRAQQGAQAAQNADEGVSELDGPNNSHVLMDLLKEKEERILALEAENMKWQQKYLEQSALQQCEVAAAPVTKERLHIEEPERSEEKAVPTVTYDLPRPTTVEARLKTLNIEMAQKDAMIRVLQQQSQEKDTTISALEYALHPTNQQLTEQHRGMETLSPARIPTINRPVSATQLNTTSGSMGDLLQPRISSSTGDIVPKKSQSATSLNSMTSIGSAQDHSDSSSEASRSDSSKRSKDERLRELNRQIAEQDSIIRRLQSEAAHIWKS
ncbi:angiomotin-like isoform X2 [Branchiostoma lanceolatum]|uniref:angiomotin-like isoform X2 n=1 Tax=Branchiostoma lanceolatum TaxID=7740 RepID=UPI003454474E